MKRETGYYWVKCFADSEWSPMYYGLFQNGQQYWKNSKTDLDYYGEHEKLFAINETRIPSPDEPQPRKNYSEKPPVYDEVKNELHIACYDFTTEMLRTVESANAAREALGVKPDTFIFITDI